MVGNLDLLSPYRHSFAYDDTEKDLQNLFIDVFMELFADQIEDIHHYGMPHLGSAKVVERFTKQDGLVVLRRQTSSDLIMRVIYANWRSLASRRGLAFLEFVLQMIWSDKWEIQRLYHSKARSNKYPSLVTSTPTRDSFLTSRIMIVLEQDVDPSEVLELAPIISKLVPANIVANIAVGIELGDMDTIAVGGAYMPYMFGNFQHFAPLESMRIEWTEWGVRRNYTLIGDTVRYNGSKTDLVSVYNATANINLRAYALTVMSNNSYNQLTAVFQAILEFHPQAVGCEVDIINSVVKASTLPDNLNDIAAAEVIKARVITSNNGNFIGNAYFPALMRHLNWTFIAGVFYYSVPADLILRSPLMYTVADTTGYYSHLDTAEQHVAYLSENHPDWEKSELQALDIKGNDGEVALFVQHYTLPVIPPLGEWQIDQGVTLLNEIANYTGLRTDGHIYYDSYADLDLTEAIIKSLHDSDMQQWQAVIDAVNELTGVIDWTFDTANSQIKYTELSEEKTISFDVVNQKIITNTASSDENIALIAETYIEAVANSIFDENIAKHFVTLADIESQLIANQVLRSEEPEVPYQRTAMTYEFSVTKLDNPNFIGINASENIPVENVDLINMFVDLRSKAIAENDVLLLQNLDRSVESAYKKDPTWTATNALYTATLTNVSFLNVVNQIFSNAQNPLATGYLSAREYLGKVAETIYLPDLNDQLIKLADLIPQFETSKVQKFLS